MQRRGKTSAGTQRWWCPICRTSSLRINPAATARHTKALFIRWLCGHQTLTDIARERGVQPRTLQRWFEPFWEQRPTPNLPETLLGQPLILDAVSLEPRRLMALIGRTRRHIVHWTFAERESHDTWQCFCASLPSPDAIVCDGQRGLQRAIQTRWPDVPFQRCLIHVLRQALARLTLHPKTPAGHDLRHLVKALSLVRTRRQKRRWLRRWKRWHRTYRSFLSERSYGNLQTKKRGWWYTHKKLRAVRSLLQNSLPHLFTFIGHPDIPRTSNHVEGGINSRLKELLHRHRGLSLSKKQTLVSHFLALKQLSKPP